MKFLIKFVLNYNFSRNLVFPLEPLGSAEPTLGNAAINQHVIPYIQTPYLLEYGIQRQTSLASTSLN